MSFRYLLLAVVYGTCLVGFTVNMIIVAANFMKWKSERSLQTCDKILSSLAISRSLCFFTVSMRTCIFQFFPWLSEIKMIIQTMNIQSTFIFYSSNWIATILCVFYCVKIVTYNYRIFIFLKTRISIMVPRLIQASLLISLISSLPNGWYSYDLKLQNLSNGSAENMTEYELVRVQNFYHQFLIFALGSFPPFIIFCAVISLLIHFLLIHTRRMRSNESHIQSPNLTSHFGAMRSMSLFLLLQIMYFIFMSLFTSGRFSHFKLAVMISWIILCSPLLLHSLFIMSTSSEVKKMLTSMCLRLNRCS